MLRVRTGPECPEGNLRELMCLCPALQLVFKSLGCPLGCPPHSQVPPLVVMSGILILCSWEGPLGTPLGSVQWKRASPRGEAGTSGFLCVSDSFPIVAGNPGFPRLVSVTSGNFSGPGPLFEGNPVDEGTTRRGTANPVHRPQRPAGSTHSSTRGLRPPEQLERQAGFPSSDKTSQSLSREALTP